MTRTGRFLTYAAAVVLTAASCVGVWLATGGRPAGDTTTGRAVQMTPEGYTVMLAAADAAIAPDFRRLDTTDDKTLAAVGPAAAQAIDTQVDSLRTVTAPPAAAAAHRQMLDDLINLGGMVQRIATNREKPPCPAAVPTPYGSVLTSVAADRVRQDSRALAAADPRFVFGRFLPATPAPAAVTRPATGTVLKKPATPGSGELKIANTGADTVLSLVPATGKQAAALTVYVRGSQSWTVTGVPAGTYQIYYASGDEWNPARKGFLSGCEFGRFDDSYRFRAYPVIDTWRITMTPTTGGNAPTTSVDPDGFPS
jgi:hypothetical protein